MNQISFSLPEILALIGVVQCTYLIVHITLRSGMVLRAGLPLVYFLVLAAAFTADLAQNRLQFEGDYYFLMQWFLWFSGPPLSVLLVVQLSDMNTTPPLRDYWVLLLLPLSFMLSVLSAGSAIGCEDFKNCEAMHELLKVTGLMAGTISLLVIFSKKQLMKTLHKQKFGKERYWLIFSLIALNTLFLLTMLLSLTQYISPDEALMLRNILGIGFAYLVSTSLLRIIPRNQGPAAQTGASAENLSEEERDLAEKIEGLLKFEKVYQEPTYSRADLARECETSETIISRVINAHFQKSFPQLMNERRIEDAKQLLRETDATIQAIAKDVGFNSLPSFNRVFKELANQAPSQYRKKTPQNTN
ncbi:MAG TPA: helix-turn-helix transcriptional regulator [Alphaproteobacteria bacterium]|nr:MAG: helix-turn-helix transcriptional regulator [Rhodospirillales bacterium]HOO81531.1 helix-turn-helix transcriptional regulator [Alphaproteobacteria bacterium]